MLLEEDEYDFQVVTDEPKPDIEELAAAALANAGIDTADQLRAARVATDAAAAAPIWHFDQIDCPCLVEAEPDKIVYEITVELPNTGLLPGMVPYAPNKPVAPPPDDDATIVTSPRQYLT